MLDGWSPEDRQSVHRFAQLRTAAEIQAASLFPALFPDLALPPDYQPPVLGPEDLPTTLLAQTVDIRSGSLAVMLTAPHGGYKTRFGDRDLPHDEGALQRDGATAEITLDARQRVSELSGEESSLHALIDRVKRQHRTPQTRAYFELQTFLLLCAMRQGLEDSAPLLHFDIHGFKPSPLNEAYDLVLGTGHRSTVGALDTDKVFAAFMEEQGYAVYLPTEEPNEAETLSADHPGTLVQRVRSLGLKNTASVQVEINSKFRTREGLELGKKLACDLGAFCLKWSKG